MTQKIMVSIKPLAALEVVETSSSDRQSDIINRYTIEPFLRLILKTSRQSLPIYFAFLGIALSTLSVTYPHKAAGDSLIGKSMLAHW